MTGWRVWFARLGEMLHRRRLERDLGGELQHHLDMLTDEHVRRGLSPADARAAARRDFGGFDQTMEAVRDRRGFRALDTIGRDVRHAFRLLAKAPGFTAAAVVTLALGFGANTAIFSLVDAVVFRPLPYPEADRLVSIWETPPARANGQVPASTRFAVAPANLADYDRAISLEALGAFSVTGKSLTGSGTPEGLTGESVTARYFEVLGTRAALGRVIRPEDNHAGGDHVVLLSDGLWRDRFGADPAVIGRTVTLDQTAYDVVGVMPPGFRAVSAFRQSGAGRFWIPITFDAELLANRDDHEVEVIARLAPGASAAAARQELQRLSAALRETLPAGRGSNVDLAPLSDDVSRDASVMLVGLLVAVGVILLIACVNVANLLIVRSLSRHRELAVRLALGASRARILGELVTQSLVLSTLGLLAGLTLAALTMKWLLAFAPATIPRLDAVAIDGRVLAFTGATSLVVGLVFGLLPLRQILRSQPVDALKVSERAVAGTWVQRWRSGLMVAEVALSLALLIGAGLMLRSLVAVNRVDLGFNPDGILAVNVNLPESRYQTPDARLAFFETLTERVSALPHVRLAAFANRLPLRGSWSSGFALEPAAEVPAPAGRTFAAGFQAVSPTYFRMLGIQLVSGREFGDDDRNGVEPVAVVSQNFAAAFFAGANPIGHRLRRFEKAPWIRIVGVVSNVRRGGRTAPEDPQVYLAAAQTTLYPVRLAELAIRADTDAADLAPMVRATIWAMDPDQTVTNVRTLDETLALGLAERRFQTLLFGLFGALALVLAVIGIHGVVSYAVWQRRPEIGLRMALGADPGALLRWLVGKMAILVAAGVALGLGTALALSRLMMSFLFEIRPTDVTTYAGAAVALSLVAIATCTAVVQSAIRIDPTVALRHE